MDKGERGQIRNVAQKKHQLLASKDRFDFLRANLMSRKLNAALSLNRLQSSTLSKSRPRNGVRLFQKNSNLELMQNSILATMAGVAIAPLEPAVDSIQRAMKRGLGNSVHVNIKKAARSGVLTPAAKLLSYHAICNFTWFGGYGLAKERGFNEPAAAAVGACASILATVPFSTRHMWKTQHIMASVYTGVPFQSIRWTIYKNLRHKSLSAVVPQPLRPVCKDRQISIFEAGAAAGAAAYIATLPLALYLSPRSLGTSMSTHVIRHTAVSALSFACFCSTYSNSKERMEQKQDTGYLTPARKEKEVVQDECTLSPAKKEKSAMIIYQRKGLQSSSHMKQLKPKWQSRRPTLCNSPSVPLLMPASEV